MEDVLEIQAKDTTTVGQRKRYKVGQTLLEGVSSSLTGRSNCQHQRDQIASIHWIRGKARELQENIYFYFIDYDKAFDCVDHNKQWKILKEMGIPDHLTCLLRNLYEGQEATV